MSASLNDIIKQVDGGDLAAAESGLESFLAAAPDHPVANFYRGVLRSKQSRFAEAAESFETAARGLKHAAVVHFNVGFARRRAGRAEAAVLPLKRALLLDPGNDGAYGTLALSLADGGMVADALRTARHGFCRSPSAQAATLATVARRAGDLRLAEAALSEAAESGRFEDGLALANFVKEVGRNPEAIELYRDLTRRFPAQPDAWFNLGVSLIDGGRFFEAAEPYARRARLIHGRPIGDDPAYADMPEAPVRPVNRLCARHRLKHDAEQYRYLADLGRLPAGLAGEWRAYQDLLDGLSEEEAKAITFRLDDARYARVARSYNRFVHIAHSNWSDAEPLSDAVDWRAIEESYLGAEPQAVAIDGFLNAEALAAMRRFCFESTIWHEIKGAGYLGAYYRSGFNDPLLFAIGEALRRRMPRVLGPHPLRMMWGYKYDQHMAGINPHADFAAVNVNFWINMAESNLDPETGGLLVFAKPAPDDWSFERYNHAPADEIYAFLGADRDRPIRVANRENRALLFDSRLFHETDVFRFRDGYVHRRINITMLFGEGGQPRR